MRQTEPPYNSGLLRRSRYCATLPLSVLLPRRIGFARAVEMSLTGQFIDAAEALRLGIVNRVVPHDDLLATARAVALDIAVKDQRAVRSLLGSFRRIAAADGEQTVVGR
jgi:enoyl-CoA hydratase